ncbi:unnamed protein product [Adineta steineri]|uniref:Cryptochrome DASH n=1 Tax=Adineta steineri TaxID=433720 RepID=A0A818PLU3_9BILA|nr:unnamed protein product [Adineta steineri]
MKRLGIVWFRDDLRLHDNETLAWAHMNNDYVIHIYCFDPRQITAKTYKCDFVKTDKYRLKFLMETIENLNTSLMNNGSGLLTYRDTPENVLTQLIEQFKNIFEITIAFQQQVTQEETDVEKTIRQLTIDNNIHVKEFWTLTLYHPDDLPYNNPKAFPDVYTQLRVALEKQGVRVRRLINIPDTFKPLPDGIISTTVPNLSDYGYSNETVHTNSVFTLQGGESSGLTHLHNYIWNKNLIKSYKETRNSLTGPENSTKFSPWLSNGSLSPRKIFFEIKKYENEQNIHDAGYWIIFELLWRDFFKFIAMKYGTRLFYGRGLKLEPYIWKHDLNPFEAWRTGNTGIPFVDANMREIMATGWMSNRGRQNVASFLTKDLGIDWRYGAVWFESILIDHDVCSNYGNWIYVAGVGTDPRENRHFNVVKQGFDYDPNGIFVRIWCPELARLPNEYIQTPWLAPAHILKEAGVELGVHYPRPIIIVPQWNQQFQNRRKSIQNQHHTQQRGINFYFKNHEKR